MRATVGVACLVALAGALTPADAAQYFLAATGGSLGNPGTREAPLPSLQAVAASSRQFSAGDELVLLPGYHGAPVLRGVNAGEVLVRPDTDARVTVQSLTLQSARHLTIRGLEISPETAPTFTKVTLITITGGSDNVVESCFAYTTQDASGWSARDWNARACNGATIRGPRHILRNNRFLNVNFGITVLREGTGALVERNVVENFSGDGLRGLADDCVFAHNTVKNCYKVNDNHDDGFQSWSEGPGGVSTGVVRGVVLRGNIFINYEDPNQPLRGTLQGIGCFGGFYEDWVIENNVVITDHWHGITLLGARNCRIVNNTVIDRNTTSPGPPWIQIGAHRDGAPSSGNVIRNNIAADIRLDAGAGIADHNLETTDLAAHFVDAGKFDLHLLASSSAIDAGSSAGGPDRDADGRSRPLDGDGTNGAQWDLGAYEFGAVPAAPSNLEAKF